MCGWAPNVCDCWWTMVDTRLPLAGQTEMALVFDALDLGDRHVVVDVLVERTDDEGRDHSDEAGDGQPPDVPDQAEAEREAQQAHDQADAGVARHVDLGVALAR